MLHKTPILVFAFLLACAFAQNNTYYDDPGYYSNEPETHIVKRGETLYAISRKYGLSVEEIMRINQLRNSTIKVGQTLDLGSISSQRISNSSVRGLPAGQQKVEGPRTYYKVLRGDNIYRIASEFGVLVDEIREWNGISKVQEGQTIIVGKNDVARIPAYRPAAESDTYESDASLLRRQSYRTSSRNYNTQPQTQNRSERSWEAQNQSTRRNADSYEEARDTYNRERDTYMSRRDTYSNRRTALNSTSDYVNNTRENNADYNDSYANRNRVASSSRNSGFSSSRFAENTDEFDYQRSRIPSAADIKYGPVSDALYEYVGDPDEVAPATFDSRTSARTRNMSFDNSLNKRSVQPSDYTGEFTELTSKKAMNNRFYAFHNTLPIGSRVKMKIPQNEGFVEVEIIDRLPSYERVMIGLSPACTAILEGAGNPTSVTIVAD